MVLFRPRSAVEVWRLAVNQRRLFIISFAIMLIASYSLVMRVPNTYEAKAVIMVASLPGGEPINSAQIAVVTERLTSRATLEGLIRDFHLYDPAELLDSSLRKMRGDIKIDTRMRGDQPGFPESFTVTFRHPDPQSAYRVVAALVAVFTRADEEFRMKTEEEARGTAREIEELGGRLTQIARQGRVVRRFGGPDPSMVLARRSSITDAVASLDDREYGLNRQIAEVETQIAERQKESRGESPEANGPLVVRKIEIEAQLKEFAGKYTAKNPKVTLAETQLAEINRRLAQASPPAADSSEIRGLKRELSRLKTELDITRHSKDRQASVLRVLPSPSLASPIEPVPAGGLDDPQAQALQSRYTAKLQRLDELKRFLTTVRERGVMLFLVSDPPVVPQSPVGAAKAKLALLALVGSFGAAVLLIAMVELPNLLRVNDDRDIEFFLGVPVLTEIPESQPVRRRLGH